MFKARLVGALGNLILVVMCGHKQVEAWLKSTAVLLDEALVSGKNQWLVAAGP